MNNYHIYAELGRGKGSVVYKGREKKTINYVAIKSVEKQFKNKVLNEVRNTQELRLATHDRGHMGQQCRGDARLTLAPSSFCLRDVSSPPLRSVFSTVWSIRTFSGS